MEGAYRDVCASHGLQIDYVEKEEGLTRRLTRRRLVAVVVFVKCCSHPLREAAEVAAQGARVKVVYLESHSVTALRGALAEFGASR